MQHIVDRSQLQLIIAGLTEGVIIIEPDQSISWANASALMMHGVETLEGLGRTVDDYRRNFALRYRNHHVLSEDQYPAERAIAGEAFSDVVVVVEPRAGEPREWVHQIRSLIINDTDGKPDCLVLVIADVTERFAAEARFERTFNANPAPAIICRISDQIVVKVNQGFLDMLGFERDEVLGHSIETIELFAEAENPDKMRERLVAGMTIPQTEMKLRLAKGGTKLVILAGQPLEVGEEPCMLFTFADLDGREKAEKSLRQSEERFAKAFQISPVPTAVMRLKDHTFINVNAAFVSQFGYGEAELIGRRPVDIKLWTREHARREFETTLEQTGRLVALEASLTCRNTNELECSVSAETVAIADVICVLATFLDITERKRTERDLMQAIDAAMADASWLSKGILAKLAALRRPDSAAPSPAASESLSKREREVLGLICQGLSDPQISKRLSLSLSTIRNHVAAIYRKLGIHRRSEAVIWAREHGFVQKT